MFFKKLSGIDIKVNKRIVSDNFVLEEANLEDMLEITSQCADVVVSLALVEHLNNAQRHFNEIYRILKYEGCLLLTTPTPLAKSVLEFLSYKLHLVDKIEIDDHKYYFSIGDLEAMLLRAGFKKDKMTLSKFMFGLNSYVVCIK